MKRARGFTLVELLVSLALLGLVASLLVIAIGVGRRTWERADARATDLATVESAQRIIRDRLERLAPLTRYDASTPYADITGGERALFFVAPAAPGREPDAFDDYRLSMSTGSELVLSSTSDVGSPAKPQRDDRVLLRNVARAGFAYFGAAPPDNLRRWRDRWVSRSAPPELIRVEVEFARGDRRRWPALLVRPVANVDTQCVLNIGNGQCKGR